MSSDAGVIPTGYRQPAQARAFGAGGLTVVAFIAALLMSICVIVPPPAAVDAGREATFAIEAIPLEPTGETPRPPPSMPEPPAVPSPPQSVPPQDSAPPSPQVASVAYPTVSAPGTGVDVTVSAAAPAPVPQGATAPAPAASADPATASPSPSAAADWRARLLGHLKRYRRYPRQAEAARQQGVARVAITLRRSGEVIAADLVRGSGYPLLDMEARATARRASPLPAPDAAIPGDPVVVEVPIDFALRR